MKITINIEAEEQDIPRLSILFSGLNRPEDKVLMAEVIPKELPAPASLPPAPVPEVVEFQSTKELEEKVDALYAAASKRARAGANRISSDELLKLRWEIVDLLFDSVCTPAVLEILGSYNRRLLLRVALHDVTAAKMWNNMWTRKELLDAVISPKILRRFVGALDSLNKVSVRKGQRKTWKSS